MPVKNPWAFGLAEGRLVFFLIGQEELRENDACFRYGRQTCKNKVDHFKMEMARHHVMNPEKKKTGSLIITCSDNTNNSCHSFIEGGSSGEGDYRKMNVIHFSRGHLLVVWNDQWKHFGWPYPSLGNVSMNILVDGCAYVNLNIRLFPQNPRRILIGVPYMRTLTTCIAYCSIA